MDNADLTSAMQEMMAKMARMETELTELKARANVVTPPVQQPANPIVYTTRRKALRRLAGGILAGLAVGTVGAAVPASVQARMIVNPPGSSGRVGAVVVPQGTATPGGVPAGDAQYKYGLVATDGSDSAFNLTKLPGGGTGVYGNGLDHGVWGDGYYGVAGKGFYGIVGSGSNIGVFGQSTSHAGYFQGNVGVTANLTVTGTINGGAKAFKIDHPLDPANKYLYHTATESPDMKNIYDGVVKLDGEGQAEIEMPEWFEVLNSDFRYTLTAIGTAMPNLHIAQKIQNRRFQIAGGQVGQEVSWMVTGIRQDEWAKAHRIPVEEDKKGEERGLYLHPELFGQSKEKSVSSLITK